MVTVLVIAHAPLASALVSAAKHVYSRDPCAASRQLVGMDVAPDALFEATVTEAKEFVRKVDQGEGVLVLTDVQGATPGNVATRLVEPGRVAAIAGVNMPMLLRSLCYGGAATLDTLVTKAMAGGEQGVHRLGEAGTAGEGKKQEK